VNSLPIGKLPSELLKKLISQIRIEDAQVVLGPAIGEDVAIIDFNNKLLVAKTDPVTFATDLIGWYAVNINANDIATSGARPRWFLATVLLPEGCTEKEAERIFQQILTACHQLHITLIGGHTEITYGLKRPIVVGCMLAEAENRLITTSGAQPGDDIVITKGISIEGTAVLAREAKSYLLSAGLSPNLIQRAANYLFSPGISVLEEALIACSSAEVHSMHDPTEGGLATGLQEIAAAAQAGIWVEESQIPILPECQSLCQQLGLDPLGLLASGTLVITLAPTETPKLLSALAEAGINAQVIGKVVEKKEGLKLHTRGGTRELPQFARDELARFLSERTEAAGREPE